MTSADLPRHIAIIMDGNGRWAVERGLPRLEGHRRGAEVVRDIATFARERGIPYLTLYSFSVQNWSRPMEEVRGLMALLEEFCEREQSTLDAQDIRLRTIGSLERLPVSTRDALAKLVHHTAAHAAMTLTLAIDYGGREEIMTAVRGLLRDVQRGALEPAAVDEAFLAARLDASFLPDPDLVIRTSGELRVSNFLLWQLAYSELYFTKVRWPDFSRAELGLALEDYKLRERRFGAVSEVRDGVSVC